MNGSGKITVAALAAVLLMSTLAACGSDDNELVPGTPSSGVTGPATDPAGNANSNPGGTTGQGGNGPDSAGDRSPDAPDNSISDRPGGPNSNGGNQGGGGSSGGVAPPAAPSPVR